MRILQLGWLDLLIAAGLNIRTFHVGRHVWNDYMEVSYLFTYLWIVVIPIWFVTVWIVWMNIEVRKSGLPASINAASKGLNQRRKLSYILNFMHFFVTRMCMVVTVMCYDFLPAVAQDSIIVVINIFMFMLVCMPLLFDTKRDYFIALVL